MKNLLVLVAIFCMSTASFAAEAPKTPITSVKQGNLDVDYVVLARTQTLVEAAAACKSFQGTGEWKLPSLLMVLGLGMSGHNPFLTLKTGRDEIAILWVVDQGVPLFVEDQFIAMKSTDSIEPGGLSASVGGLKRADVSSATPEAIKTRDAWVKELEQGIPAVCVKDMSNPPLE